MDDTPQNTPRSEIKSVAVKHGQGETDPCSITIKSRNGTSHTVSLNSPNNTMTAAIDAVVSKMRSTTNPLQDLQMAFDQLKGIVDSYREHALKKDMEDMQNNTDKLSKIDTRLDQGREELRLATAIPFPDFNHHEYMQLQRRANANKAVMLLLEVLIEFPSVISSLAPGNTWPTVTVVEEHVSILQFVNILCALWKEAFVLGLFRWSGD